MAQIAAERYTGASIKRSEDPRILTGRGRYVDDLKLPGMLHAAFVRSPLAHGRVLAVDASAARSLPGVVAVPVQRPSRTFTGAVVLLKQRFYRTKAIATVQAGASPASPSVAEPSIPLRARVRQLYFRILYFIDEIGRAHV